MQENQAVWRLSHSTAMVRSKTATKCLILKQFKAGIDFLMHIAGLIDPNKRLDPAFGFVQLDLTNGTTVNGVLMEEREDGLVMKVGAKPDTLIMNSSIAERKNSPSSMPDMKQILSKREIRDLDSSLSTLTKERE